jgi:flagellar biosynthesis protein FliQ
MSEADAYSVISMMLAAVVKASLPVLILALVIGLVIAFFQALTQIQEMTLTFVPKIVAIFLGLIASTPFIYETLSDLSTDLFEIIRSGAL